MKTIVQLLILILFLMSLRVYASEIGFYNGEKVEGTILEQNDVAKDLKFKSKDGVVTTYSYGQFDIIDGQTPDYFFAKSSFPKVSSTSLFLNGCFQFLWFIAPFAFLIYLIIKFKKRSTKASRYLYLGKILLSILSAVLGGMLYFPMAALFPFLTASGFGGMYMIMLFVPIFAVVGAFIGFGIGTYLEKSNKASK